MSAVEGGLQPRTPEHCLGRGHTEAAAGHGCVTSLLLHPRKNGGVCEFPMTRNLEGVRPVRYIRVCSVRRLSLREQVLAYLRIEMIDRRKQAQTRGSVNRQTAA